MKRFLLIVIASGVMLVSPAEAVTSLYCQDKMATGFVKEQNTNVWKTKKFILGKYTIQFNTDYTLLRGMTFLPAKCNTPYKNKPELLFCVHTFPTHEIFIYNKNTKRYTFSKVTAGYSLDNSDSETLHVGTCKEL